MPTDLDEVRRFGRDLRLPDAADEPIRTTGTGDLRTIAGRANLHRAQLNRALSAPGSLIHRPLYGGGLTLLVEELADPVVLSGAADRLRRSALSDPRLEDAEVSIEEGAPGDPLRADTLTTELKIKARGDDFAEELTIITSE